jgi:antitoxin PrlF
LPQRTVPASTNMEFTLSNCYPITLPQALPGALQLGKGGKIQSHIHPSGELLLSRVAGREVDDTLLGQFLGFLAGDMANHPERLQAVDARFVQRLQSLVGGIELISICSCRRMLNERGQDHTQDCNQNQ